MILLAVDTTTTLGSTALVETDAHGGAARVVAARRERVSTHSETLLGMVRAVLDEARVPLAEVAAIAAAAGPGSFTGLRIGLATVKGLCLATERPLVLVSSLAALATRAPAGAPTVACLDALKGEVYAGFYTGGPLPGDWPAANVGGPVAERPAPATLAGGDALPADERVLPPEALARLLAPHLEAAAATGARLHLVGDGPAKWPALAALPSVDASDTAPPDAVDVARLAALRLATGVPPADLASAAPRYIRPSEAELMAARRS